MQRDNQPWRPMPRPDLQWLDDGTPGSAQFDDVYFSREGGLAEGRHVFLAGNQLPGRWADHPHDNFVVGETGFGTGLNFLLTWQAWSACPGRRPKLHYISIEQYPLRTAQLTRALAQWPELASFSSALLTVYPAPVPGTHRLLLAGGAVTLDLWWAEAFAALDDMAQRELPLFDAWYLDGFAPARNADMWRGELLQRLGNLSRPGATLATFTAAGQVRRDLQAAGFRVSKSPGFGRKREQLTAIYQPDNTVLPTALLPTSVPLAAVPLTLAETAQGDKNGTVSAPGSKSAGSPWDLQEQPPLPPRSALVLGAGLAGCATAAALARRGVAVTLLERASLAGAASGNPQGVLYTRLSKRHSTLVDFALLSYQFAQRQYRQMFAAGALSEGRDGSLCGSFHQQPASAELDAMAELLCDVPELAQVLDAKQASQHLGIQQPRSGFWFPDSGWLRPASLCRLWASQAGVTLREDCGAVSLAPDADQWQARDSAGELLAEADIAVVACAGASTALANLDWLPLQVIRGQTTQLPAGKPYSKLRAVLCHEGYIAPASGEHCIGATFNLGDPDPTLRSEDHRFNLTQLAKAVPDWEPTLAALDPATLDGRAGFRCTSSDYLPLVGPVPDLPRLIERFAALRQNARRDIAAYGVFVPGLYLNTGHGSRGLTSTPLAAELLASLICSEPAPLARPLIRALAPSRFPIRDLGRNRL